MKLELLRGSIEALKKLRDELRGKVEESTIQELGKIIDDLDHAYKQNPSQISAADVLKAIGIVLEAVPAIAEIMKLLSGMN